MTEKSVDGETEKTEEALKKENNFEWILDELPFGISVQKADRTIIGITFQKGKMLLAQIVQQILVLQINRDIQFFVKL
ncbi:MAG: hypothetical protein ACW96U_12010 [Candidatus Heimdallarchaeaceae archaeon]|jgi:hypothetical protein